MPAYVSSIFALAQYHTLPVAVFGFNFWGFCNLRSEAAYYESYTYSRLAVSTVVAGGFTAVQTVLLNQGGVGRSAPVERTLVPSQLDSPSRSFQI